MKFVALISIALLLCLASAQEQQYTGDIEIFQPQYNPWSGVAEMYEQYEGFNG